MKVQLLSPNGSALRVAVQAFAQEAKTACQPDNLVPLADQGSVRMLGDTSRQMIVDEAILHPYSHPPGTNQVIADCDVVLKGMERWKGNDVAEMRQSVGKFCSKMNTTSALSVAGGLGLGAGLYFANLGWVGAGLGVAAAVAGVVYAEKQKGQARDFESKLNGWDKAIQTGNPSRMPIPAGNGAVSFEYVFMCEKQAIGVSRSYRIPGALYAPTTWSGAQPQSGPNRTLVSPENVARLDLKAPKKERPRGKFDGPPAPVTDVLIPESIAQPARMAEELSERPAGPAVQDNGSRVTVAGIAVKKRKTPLT